MKKLHSLALLLLALPLAACGGDDAGDDLEEAGEDIQDAAEEAADEVEAAADQAAGDED